MKTTLRQAGVVAIAMAMTGLPLNNAALGQDSQPSNAELMQIVRELQRKDAEKDQRIADLERKLASTSATALSPTASEAAQATARREALDQMLADLDSKQNRNPSDIWSKQVGGATLRLIDVSLDLMVAAGGSTANDEELGNLQGGGHDPRKRGFTLQQAELSLDGAGAVVAEPAWPGGAGGTADGGWVHDASRRAPIAITRLAVLRVSTRQLRSNAG